MLHSFCKGSSFRRWILHPDCPPLLKFCRQLIDKAYSLTTQSEEEKPASRSLEISQETVEIASNGHQPNKQLKTPTPRALSSFLGRTDIQCYSQISTRTGGYFATPGAGSAGKGNSFVCYYPGGDTQLEWVACQIRHIFKEDGMIRLAVQQSLPFPFHRGKTDPFRAFWDQGFQAKSVSSMYSDDMEIIEYDWVVAHTARWKLHPSGLTVCLNLQVRISDSQSIQYNTLSSFIRHEIKNCP